VDETVVARAEVLRRLAVSPSRLRELTVGYRLMLGALPRTGLTEAQVARLAEILAAEETGRTSQQILSAMEPLDAEISLEERSWQEDQEQFSQADAATWQEALERLSRQQEEESARLLGAIVRLQQEVSQLRRVVEEISSRRARKGGRW
jgi:uncharacterized protein YicC (UPF0701 family)